MMEKKKAFILLVTSIYLSTLIIIFDIGPQIKNLYNGKQLKTIMQMKTEQPEKSSGAEQSEKSLVAEQSEKTKETEDQMKEPYRILYDINPDTVGWIRIPGTIVDYVMVQGKDNQTYLNRDFYGNSSKYGTIFVDAYCRIDRNFESQNTIVYGHNMKDGQMFGTLKKYRDSDYYRQHPYIEAESAYTAKIVWKIFSVFIANSAPSSDEGYAFAYRKRDFDTQQEFISWSEECKKRSLLNIPVDVQPFDQILTLSTCTYESDNARLVVMARRIRDGESR